MTPPVSEYGVPGRYGVRWQTQFRTMGSCAPEEFDEPTFVFAVKGTPSRPSFARDSLPSRAATLAARFRFPTGGSEVRVRLSHLAPDRPLCVIDLETTGPDPARDRVVEVGVVKVEPDGTAASVRQLVHPGRPIPPAATAVHRIGDSDVAAAPPFRAVARPLAEFLTGADLAGFGVARFDLPLLAAEFARAGVPFAVAGRGVADALAVFHRHEPRDLAAAVRFYLGRDHPDAHSAVADARAALEVLDAQVGRYGLPPAPAGIQARMGTVDVAGQFRRGPDGGPVFGFGKHVGRPLAAVAATDPGYLDWLLGRPLLDDARALVRAARSAAAGRRPGARGGTK